MILSEAYFLISLHTCNWGILSHKMSFIWCPVFVPCPTIAIKQSWLDTIIFHTNRFMKAELPIIDQKRKRLHPILHTHHRISLSILGWQNCSVGFLGGPDIAFLCNVEEHQEFPFSHSPPIYSFSFWGKHFFDHSDKRFIIKIRFRWQKSQFREGVKFLSS